MMKVKNSIFLIHQNGIEETFCVRFKFLTDLSSKIRRSDDPYLLLEFSSLKLLEMDKSVSIESILSQKNIEQKYANKKEKSS